MKKRSYELLMANRKYKDTIFRWIFSIIENLLSLYNAVTGKNYQNPEELEIVTLENAIYMGMKNCHVLWEYAQYVERVRKYAAEMPLNEAVELAITECIREGILAEFLQHNRAEVYKVSIFEYDKEKEEKKLRKAERECGREEGLQQGLQQGRIEGEKCLLELIAKMDTGGDTDKISQLEDMKILDEMKEKYGVR